MNIVNSGSKYMIYGEDVKTFKTLPADTYTVNFDQMAGYSLLIHNDLSVNEKIYGPYIKKVDKVLKTFSATNRNLGIILSGPKGVGKSMFARQLAKRGKENSLPLIIVNNNYPGIEDFISSIHQECIVLFDEFEKNFKDDNDNNPQEKLLSLFDGIDDGKKLFVITCNRPRELNEYLLNRPGRFHYHFTITVPTKEEVREYMNDNLAGDARQYIDKLVNASCSYRFTYDILRAIAFELNNGYELNETLEDLNISKDIFLRATAEATFTNGLVAAFDDPVSIDPEYDTVYYRHYTFTKESTSKMPNFVKNALESCRIGFNINDIEADEYGYHISGDCASIDISNTMHHLNTHDNEIDDDTYKKIEKYVSDLKVSEIRLLLVHNEEIRSFYL